MSCRSLPVHKNQLYLSHPQAVPTVAVVKTEEVARDVAATDKGVDDVIDSVASGAGKVWVITFCFRFDLVHCC